MHQSPKYGILLVNLGTADEATPAAIKRFLKQFLSDKRVVDAPHWWWQPLLNGIILPIRAPKVAKVYESVWFEDGSPLLVYSQMQAKKLSELLQLPVELGMTYGNPSMQRGIESLVEQGCDALIILPLYPQYSGTTTAAASDAFLSALSNIRVLPSYQFISAYHDHPLYIQALADKVRQHWDKHGQSDYLLCSYHGIPQRFADLGDVYPTHCQQTTKLLAQALDLDETKIGMSYQSRFGREPWLTPYTDQTLETLAKKQYANLDIISPAFSVDCIETLEEIAMECQSIYQDAGGKNFRYIECLNADDTHIQMMAELIKPHLLKS